VACVSTPAASKQSSVRSSLTERLAALTADGARRTEEVAAALDQARAVEEALAEKLGRGEISLSAWEVAQKHAHARVAKLQAEREELAVATANAIPELPEKTMQAILDAWDSDEAENGPERRGMLMRTIRAGWRIAIEPRPHLRGKPVFDPTRVKIVPAGTSR
jgi:hypothetical protein